jgi:hypothetical protein
MNHVVGGVKACAQAALGHHKTYAQRQQEAKERKRRYLAGPEKAFLDAIHYRGTNSSSAYADYLVARQRAALCSAYIDAGYSPDAADILVEEVASGCLHSWPPRPQNAP